jgi:hypothetical protein
VARAAYMVLGHFSPSLASAPLDQTPTVLLARHTPTVKAK